MAQEEDIKQNIILDYQTNANETAKEIGVLSDSTEKVTTAKQKDTKATKDNDNAYKSMRTQVKEATQEMYRLQEQYGLTSKEAIEATKKVAGLKDQMADAKNIVEGFNPDRKFQGLATAVNAAAVAASGITSGMALFGAESAETEKALLKVQAAMAFSDAVGRITEMGDDFMKLKAQVSAMFTTLTTAKTVDTTATQLNTASKAESIVVEEAGAVATVVKTGALSASTIATTAATVATNIFNASLAVLLSPIVLIIAGIAGLVAGIGYLTGAFGDFSGEGAKAEKANKALSSEIDNLTKSNKKATEQTDLNNYSTLAMAKASGKSADEIRKLSEELINQEVAEKRLNAVKAYSIYLEARRVAGLEDATDAQKETLKKATEFYKQENGIYNDSIKEKNKLIIDNRVAEVQEETDHQAKVREKQREHNRKLLEDAKKADEEKLKQYKDSLKRQQDAEAALQKEVDDAISAATDKNAEQFLTDQEIQERAINEKYFRTIELAKQQGKDTLELEIAQANEINNVRKENDDKVREEEKKKRDQQIEDEKTVADAKLQIQNAQLNNAASAINLLGGFAGKNKKLQAAAIVAENAVGIAKSIINTNASIPAINAKYSLIPGGTALAAAEITATKITTGISIASSIAATAKALSALGGGGSASGGGGGSVADGPTGGSVPQVGFQNSGENQIATTIANNQNEQPPIKAFVVSSDVTTAQNLDRNKINANSLGG